MLAIAAFVALGHAAEPDDDLVKPTAIPSPLRVPREGRSESARAVQVSAACVTKSSFKIALPNGVVVTARRDHWTDYGGGDGVWSGHLDSEPLSRVTIGIRKGILSGAVDRAFERGNELFELSATPAGTYQWYQHDETRIPRCLRLAPRPPTGTAPDTTAGTATVAAAATAASPIGIDIMVVYSTAARVRYGQSGIEAKIIQAVTDANTAFANSLVNIRYTLAYMGEVAYTETGAIASSLSALQASADGIVDQVHALRDQVGADLVCMVTEDTDACGLGYVMTSAGPGFASAAFSVVYSGCLSSLSLGHELGHNHGCQHDRANATFQGTASYAYGWRNCATDGTGFRSVMSYACGAVPRINYFSNPDLVYLGSALGVDPVVDPVNAAHNARNLNETAAVVAAFRTSTGANVALIPAAPTGLAAAASSGQAKLSWADNATNESGYSVERSPNGTTWTVIASLPGDSIAYADATVAAGTSYSYRVRASNAAGASPYSNVATLTMPALPPSAPTGLALTVNSSSQISLKWTDTATTETSYSVERSADGVTYTVAATLGANSVSFAATGLSSATKYFFRVRCGNAGGFSAYSTALSATTLPTAPSAPSGLAATAASAAQINLAWVDNATNETGYSVERSADGVTFTVIASLGANVTSYSNTGLAASTLYYYRVRASNTGGNSAYSAVASTKTQASTPSLTSAPAAPSGLTLTAASRSQINLKWTDNSTKESGFLIERSTNGTSWSQIASTGANVITYSNTGLKANTLYYYRVRATNSSGKSAYTAVVSIRTLP